MTTTTTNTTDHHFGPHDFENSRSLFRPCRIDGCPVVREGRSVLEETKRNRTTTATDRLLTAAGEWTILSEGLAEGNPNRELRFAGTAVEAIWQASCHSRMSDDFVTLSLVGSSGSWISFFDGKLIGGRFEGESVHRSDYLLSKKR